MIFKQKTPNIQAKQKMHAKEPYYKGPLLLLTYLMAEGTDCLPGWFPKNVCLREAAVLRRKGARPTKLIPRLSLRMLPVSEECWVREELLVIREDVWAEVAGRWGPKASAVVCRASLWGAD